MASPSKNSFFHLTPSGVLDAVEAAIQTQKPDARATGRALFLNSLENRVIDIEFDDGSHVVTKFYRPGRWTREQILDEHLFLLDLQKSEIPVVAPLLLTNGTTLENFNDEIYFAVFPKVRGRILDELDDKKLKILGRYLGRLHGVGKTYRKTSRTQLNIQSFGIDSYNILLNCNQFEGNVQYYFEKAVERFLDAIDPLWDSLNDGFLLHGDCHLGNVLWDGDKPFFVDFDDAVVAPAVQDIWMVVRGRDKDAVQQREILIDAYQEFQDFPDEQLDWIEPLRGLRMIHYAAWIARRWDDPSFRKAFPLFGTSRYWQEEIEALEETCENFI